jgi:nucleoside-diphosphate-sugar epimerase
MMQLQDKTVLVTGSSGFIGSHLVEALAGHGAKVLAVDKQPPRYSSKYQQNINTIILDIARDKPKIQNKIDIVIHLAAYAVPNLCESNPNEAFRVNVQGTHNMLKFAKENKVNKFVFTSSALLYGRMPKYLPIDESHPIDATENTYCVTKKLGEDLCNLFKDGSDISITILRLFNVFGPRQDVDYLIPTIIGQARKGIIELWSDKPTRDLNYVENTIDAILTVAESSVGGIYNVGSNEEVRVADIAKIIASKYNAELKFLNKDVIGSLRLKCNNQLMQDVFGWRPRIGFGEGLERTLQWYEQHYERFTETAKVKTE